MDYTPAQVGAANTPDLHLTDDAPDAQHTIDFVGDEFDSLPSSWSGSSARNWRGGADNRHHAAPGIGLGTDQSTRANEHAHMGRPDGRRTDTDLGGHPTSPELVSLSPSPESPHNDRDYVAMNPVSAPSRPAAGFTGEDPARPAQSQRAWFLRPFDQWAAQHPGPVDKVGQVSPLAAQPPSRGRLIGAFPSPAGSESTAVAGIGAQPNSFRLVPRPWDELLVNTGGAADTTTANRRTNWRL